MNTHILSELLLYRYRYRVSHVLLAGLTLLLLVLYITTLPLGLSHAEEVSAVASSKLTLDQHFLQTVQSVDLPYHLIQKLSLQLFGLGSIGVRLPSMIFAAGSAFFLFLMLRRWLQENVAVVMGLIVATSSWFLVLGRSGTPEIMIVFWTTLLLYLATLISQETKHYLAWKALIVACLGLSFYTPLMIYVFLVAALTAVTQPHVRALLKYDEKLSFFLGLILFAAALVPLGWQAWHQPEVLRPLLALPSTWPEPTVFLHNMTMALEDLINPWHIQLTEHITPLVTLPVAALAGVGLVRVVRDIHSVRSHLALLWLAVLVPMLGLSGSANLAVLFVPVLLLGAIGVQVLFQYWYRLFPHNPYARIFGLLPLGVLIVSIVQLNYQAYFMALPYAPGIATTYDLDPLLLHGELNKLPRQPIVAVVPADQVALFQINHDQFKDLHVVAPAEFVAPTNGSVLIAETAIGGLSDAQRNTLSVTQQKLIVDDRAADALRFRLFTF